MTQQSLKLYMVEITMSAVVLAMDEEHAHFIADIYKQNIARDDKSKNAEVSHVVLNATDLNNGWNGYCIPYGGDGVTNITDLLTTKVNQK